MMHAVGPNISWVCMANYIVWYGCVIVIKKQGTPPVDLCQQSRVETQVWMYNSKILPLARGHYCLIIPRILAMPWFQMYCSHTRDVVWLSTLLWDELKALHNEEVLHRSNYLREDWELNKSHASSFPVLGSLQYLITFSTQIWKVEDLFMCGDLM